MRDHGNETPLAFKRRTLNRRLAATVAAAAMLGGTALVSGAVAGGGTEAASLRSALAGISELVQHRVRPPALRLARALPDDADRVNRLREPAGTAQAQLKIVLNELRQMNNLALDPHYLPALVAAGRAYMAVSGQDPVTGTTVNPDYLGLESELATDAARLQGAAGDAAKLAASVKRLSRQLIRAKRRASRLEGGMRRLQPRTATASAGR